MRDDQHVEDRPKDGMCSLFFVFFLSPMEMFAHVEIRVAFPQEKPAASASRFARKVTANEDRELAKMGCVVRARQGSLHTQHLQERWHGWIMID